MKLWLLDSFSYNVSSQFYSVCDSARISRGCFDQLELGEEGETNKTKHETFPAEPFHKRTKFNCKVNWGYQSSSGCRQ